MTSTQIVFLGQFSPEVFNLDSLRDWGLFGPAETSAAEPGQTGRWLADISIDWCRILATKEKLIVTSHQAPWIRLADFSRKLLGEALPETVIGYMGINRTVSFDASSMEARDRLGRDLAPRSVWGEWGEILDRDKGAGESGLSTLTMRQGHELNDRYRGYIEARIQPGQRSGPSIQMTINDHYEAPDGKEVARGGELLRVLADNFDASIKRSEWIITQIMKRVK